MSVREVQEVPLDSQHPDFNIKLVKMLSSLVLQLSSLFRGPLGQAVDQPSLQEVPAYDYKSKEWILAFQKLCNSLSKPYAQLIYPVLECTIRTHYRTTKEQLPPFNKSFL